MVHVGQPAIRAENHLRRAVKVGGAHDSVGGGIDDVDGVGGDVTTSRYRPSRENPRPWTSISPLYIAPRTSASTSMRGLPSAIVPSTVLVFGLITLTVLEDWSAVYTRSFAEIGCAPGNAGACVTCSCGGWTRGVGVADEDPEVSSTPSATATIDAVNRPPTIQVARRFVGRSDMRDLSLALCTRVAVA